MDADLAFCLERFIDDQVQLIDDQIVRIGNEQSEACQRLADERKKVVRPPAKKKGSHQEDQALVDGFTQELRDKGAVKEQKTIIDDEACIATLRAEASTKVNATSKYISRLRNSARMFPNTTSFAQFCKEIIEYLDSTPEFDKNFQDLMVVLQETDANNVLQNVQIWWKDAYGARIAEVNSRNNKFNQAGSDKNYVALSPTSRILANAKKLIAARTVILVEPPKVEIIKKFVRQLLIVDVEKRENTNPEELINRLNQMEVDEMIDYAKQWLEKRDRCRNEKEEPDQYEVQMEEVKAEFGRRKIAQEAKKLALAALLCRLAVGSSNGDQFDQQLKSTVSKQKDSNQASFPVISGEIQEPEVQELPVVVQLELEGVNMNRWANNSDGIRERFASGLCQAFQIPKENIRVDNVDRNKGMIHLCVKPPYGKNVVDSLNGGAPDAAARMLAVRKCCRDMDAPIESITLGEFGLKIEDKLMDPRWNKVYAWEDNHAKGEHYWSSPINQGGKPYYCPSGWKRFGIKVAEDDKEFDARWGNWYVAYHGTRGENASKILTSGLKVSTQGCFYNDGEPRVYVSPSVEYCAHPRYAYPWKQTKKNGEVCWYQLVFQCRVNPASINDSTIHPETLVRKEYKQIVQVDSNFSNEELEWIIIGKPGEDFITKEIICYGLMLRITNIDPEKLTPSHWWKSSLYGDVYKK